jgi:hypothetical protein
MVISLTVSSEFTQPAHKKAFEKIIMLKETRKLENLAARVVLSVLKYRL